MDIDSILNALPEETRDEAKTFLSGLNPITGIDTKEKALDFIKSNEVFSKAKDFEVTKGISTFKDNHTIDTEKIKEQLEKEIRDQVVEELNPKETDHQKEIREMKEREKARDKKDELKDLAFQRKERKELTILNLVDEGFPLDMVDMIVTNDDDKTLLNIDTYKHAWNKERAIRDKMAKEHNIKLGNTGMPKGGKSINLDDNPYLWRMVNGKMDQDHTGQSELYRQDPAAAEKMRVDAIGPNKIFESKHSTRN